MTLQRHQLEIVARHGRRRTADARRAARAEDLRAEIGRTLTPATRPPFIENRSWSFRGQSTPSSGRSTHTRARTTGDAVGDEVLSTADDARLDPQDRRIRVDTRKWLLEATAADFRR
jgi:hypothetical protein